MCGNQSQSCLATEHQLPGCHAWSHTVTHHHTQTNVFFHSLMPFRQAGTWFIYPGGWKTEACWVVIYW